MFISFLFQLLPGGGELVKAAGGGKGGCAENGGPGCCHGSTAEGPCPGPHKPFGVRVGVPKGKL